MSYSFKHFSGAQPSGTINITENGTYDVTEKASAVVNVSGGGGASRYLKIENTSTELEVIVRVGTGETYEEIVVPTGAYATSNLRHTVEEIISSLSVSYDYLNGFNGFNLSIDDDYVYLYLEGM